MEKSRAPSLARMILLDQDLPHCDPPHFDPLKMVLLYQDPTHFDPPQNGFTG